MSTSTSTTHHIRNGKLYAVPPQRFRVFASGNQRGAGYDIVDTADEHQMLLIGWNLELEAAEKRAGILNVIKDYQHPGDFATVRFGGPMRGVLYETVECDSGRVLYSGPSAREAVERTKQARIEREVEGMLVVPDAAHAAVDAMLSEFGDEDDEPNPECEPVNPHCTFAADCRHGAVEPQTDADLLTSLRAVQTAHESVSDERITRVVKTAERLEGQLWTLNKVLRLEADVLEATGTIGPNARRVLASIIREAAKVEGEA